MKHTTKRKLKTWPIVTLFLIIIFAILIYCVIDIKNSLGNNKKATEIQVLEQIKGYDYSLNENDSKYYKELFKKLKDTLEKEELEEQKYAELVGQLFLTDFFSLNEAINKNDVGGEQFVYNNYKEDFLKYAKNTVYKYVENNIYGDRKQELPTVTSVEVTNIKQDTYKSKGGFTDDNAYYISLKINYEKDLDYQTVSTLTLVHNDNKLEIVNMK